MAAHLSGGREGLAELLVLSEVERIQDPWLGVDS